MTFGFLSHLDLNFWLFHLPIMQKLVKQKSPQSNWILVRIICPVFEDNSLQLPNTNHQEAQMTKAFILDFLADHKQEFHNKYGVTKIGLFGSYSRDEQREDSDIDIAIEMEHEKKNIRTFFGFKREMESIFGKRVDLGIESTLKPLAKQYIMREIIYV